MSRKSLPIALVVLALLASPAVFAADEPAVPLSQEQFMSTLQVPSDAGEKKPGEKTPELEGNAPAPILQHGAYCSYQGQGCRSCVLPNGSSGYRSCEIQRCLYNNQWHNHYINCGNCAPSCPI